MCNISFSSRALVNKVSKEISFTTTSNLKKHQSITSKVSAKGNDSNRTDEGEYLQNLNKSYSFSKPVSFLIR